MIVRERVVRFAADAANLVLVSTAELQTPRVQVQEALHQTAENPQMGAHRC